MKKILVFFLALLFALPATVHAESPMLKTEDDLFFKTYQPEEIALMSVINYDEAEELILDAWTDLERTINVSNYNFQIEELDEFYKKVLFAHPLYFYVQSSFSYTVDRFTQKVLTVYVHYKETFVETDEDNIILPDADIDKAKEKINEKTQEIKDATDEILFYINGNMTEFEKVMTVHDYMVREYSYDTDYYDKVCNDSSAVDPSHFGYSLEMMVEKTGLCQGYTLAFSHVMQQLGIDTAFISSETMNHAWNLVKVDGKWYHIDVTWDDIDCCETHAHHNYGLLSTDHIRNMNNPHYGFDTGDLEADSDIYDNAPWHSNVTPLAFCHGIEYWIDQDNLVNSNGEIIYENLSGTDDWRIDSSDLAPQYICTVEGTYAGVVAYNHKIYFNTDTEIFCYDEKGNITSVTKKSGQIPGIAGLRIENNELVYDILYLADGDKAKIKEGGRIVLEKVRVMDPYIEDGKLIAKLYRKDATPMTIFAVGNGIVQSKKIEESGYITIDFDASEEQTLFFWDENLKPLRDKDIVSAN